MTRARDKASAVVANFTSTGIDDNADANAITIDSSERVGIGTTSPVALLTTVAADGVMADQYVAKFTNSEATAGQNYGVFVAGGSTSADESFSVRKFDNSATYFKVRGDGNVSIGGTLANTGLITASAGVAIGGTGAANTLDDYEEGSWTGTLTGAVAPSSSQTATGSYTKIGRLVTVNISFSAKNTSGASGVLEVRGLPFSISDQGWGSYLSYNTANTASSSIEAVAWANTGTKIIFYDWADSGVWNQTTITAGADRYLFVSIKLTHSEIGSDSPDIGDKNVTNRRNNRR